MDIQRALLAAAFLAAGAAAIAAPAAAASKAEKQAIAQCTAKAKAHRIKLKPGACEDPRSRAEVTRLTAAREACTRVRNIATGVVKANRCQETDEK